MSNQKLVSATDICAIVEACSKAGVISLQFGNLKISFTGDIENYASESLLPIYTPPESSADSKVPQSKDTDYLDQLAVENPVEWERQILEDKIDGR